MPLPEPRPDEEREEFVGRCMEEASSEFESDEQALAVCFTQWREASARSRLPANHPGFTRFVARDGGLAEILIYEDVGEWFGGITAKSFADELKKLGAVNELYVRLNSSGGNVFDGIAIYNMLRQHDAKITTTIDGIAASIASIIYMAGDKRIASENASLMIHEPWTMAIGTATELRQQADVMEKLSVSLAQTYAKRTGKALVDVARWMEDETWFSAAEMEDAGFAHQVLEELPMAASVDFDLSRFRRVPDYVTKTRSQGKVAGGRMDRDNRVKLATMAKRVVTRR